jgi:hypothetical protein
VPTGGLHIEEQEVERLAVRLSEHNGVNREEHARQTKNNSERTVPAHEQSFALRSQFGELLRSPNLSRPMGKGGNKGLQSLQERRGDPLPRHGDRSVGS